MARKRKNESEYIQPEPEPEPEPAELRGVRVAVKPFDYGGAHYEPGDEIAIPGLVWLHDAFVDAEGRRVLLPVKEA